ncbi:hypothetical protein [Arthrobacter sp. E3]|uniref:hypothetical protein n=1 Tax=Arthrobacter sp. E3 TaxID=517402 RepID=UPI001A93C55C|nr:hypothetical protein [Arthrobacter sp. E3]
MPFVLESVAVGSLAASTSASFNIQPYFALIIIGAVLLIPFLKAASRKRRSNRANPYNPAKPSGRTGAAHQPGGATYPANAPYAGTLLNGIPMKNYDSSHAHQGVSFANERMKAEAELKRQLDALDSARRNGQVTAEQYATHREAIFRNF